MSEEISTPRWDKIDNLYSKFDTILDDAFTKDELNFLEVQIAMMMINEKLQEEKFRVYAAYLTSENDEKKADNSGIYR